MRGLFDLFRSRDALKRELAQLKGLRYLVAWTPGDPGKQEQVLASLDTRIAQIQKRLRA